MKKAVLSVIPRSAASRPGLRCFGRCFAADSSSRCAGQASLSNTSDLSSSASREKWVTRKEYTRIRSLEDLHEDDPVFRLTKEMGKYIEWTAASERDPFFHRKSNRVVLALLHVEIDGTSHYVRGINTEVSLPTGTLCAERAAIVKARTEFPGVMREHMRGIAVVEVPNASPGEDVDYMDLGNPLPPCGACREWLEKIQEKSRQFYVLTYPDLDLCEVQERFLFWAIREETDAPEDLGPWACRMCGEMNIPFSTACGNCTVDRFSLEYNQFPTYHRKLCFAVLETLTFHGPTTLQGLHKLLCKTDKPKKQRRLVTSTVKILESNEREDERSGEVYGRLIWKNEKGQYTISETGRRVHLAWIEKRLLKKASRKATQKADHTSCSNGNSSPGKATQKAGHTSCSNDNSSPE